MGRSFMERRAVSAAQAQPDRPGKSMTGPRAASLRSMAVAAQGSGSAVAQRRLDCLLHRQPSGAAGPDGAVQRRENRTGLPDRLKAGIEALSGLSLDHVRVHYNSSRPARLQAHAYTQGADIHVGPGQERHLPHEAWHAVQQAQGRVRATRQLKEAGGVPLNDSPALEREADVMGARAGAAGRQMGIVGTGSYHGSPGEAGGVAQFAVSQVPPRQGPTVAIQRVIGDYKAGTLAITTRAMRNLDEDQMEKIQDLHDDPHNHYTIEEARKIVTSSSNNPYEWDVINNGNYFINDPGIQSILENFGKPTSSVVKVYDDLASRVGFDIGHTGKGTLTASTLSDVQQMLEASKPLHLAFNPFLKSAWEGNLDDYSGSKTGIPLYSVMRSEITKNFKGESLGSISLNDFLNEVSSRPAELHHLLYKAHYPDFATSIGNLMLTERSASEKIDGPGQHELMHMVASGNDKNKFNVLLPQFTHIYKSWASHVL